MSQGQSIDIPEHVLDNVRSRLRIYSDDIEKWKEELAQCNNYYREFLERFPFHREPGRIDLIKKENLYNPESGDKDYFFYYVEHKLRCRGSISVGSARPWIEAAEKIDVFKKLLRKILDPNISLHEKIDAEECNELGGWGGDRHIVKKIISLYNPENVVPVFNTAHLEKLIELLNLGDIVEKYSIHRFGRRIQELTLGEKYEVYNDVLLALKNSIDEMKSWDNVIYMYFLCETYELKSLLEKGEESRRSKPTCLGPLLFPPKNELEVIVLFTRFCEELGFPYILELYQSKYPDARVIDKDRNVKTIEFELYASNFIEHRHDPDIVDYIICWENDLPEDHELQPKIKELKTIIPELLQLSS